MAPFAWFKKRDGAKRSKAAHATFTNISSISPPLPLVPTTMGPSYHTKNYKFPSSATTVNIPMALSNKYSGDSSPISPPGTTVSGTTLVNTITSPTYPISPLVMKEDLHSQRPSSEHGHGSVSVSHLPFSRATTAPIPTNHISHTAAMAMPPARFRSGSEYHPQDSSYHSRHQISSNMTVSSHTEAAATQRHPLLTQHTEQSVAAALENTKVNSRARRYLTRVQTRLNKSAQNLHEQSQQQSSEQQPLKHQSSRGTFKGVTARFRTSVETARQLETVVSS